MDQLEIIGASGEVEFYNLDPGKGLTNIGQHPENDIVINDPQVAPFQAMLDHRQKPYQLIVLSDEGAFRRPLQNLDHLELGTYTLILVEGNGAAAGTGQSVTDKAATFPSTAHSPAPFPARPGALPPPVGRPEPLARIESGAGSAGPDSMPKTVAASAMVTTSRGVFNSRPMDHEDEVIITELSQNEWDIDVEQTAVCQVTIINGGQLVAAFQVSLQGLDPSWVTVSQPVINLNEGERATITLSITPPRLPTSKAGAHNFAVIVTSSNHPGRMSQRGATLTVNPYYEFAVDELSPRRQTIPWSKRFGRTALPIINKGNSPGAFRLEGSNEERACTFEFDVPGEVVPQATQAEVRLNPQESIVVPIHITPHSRRLVGFRKRKYSYTIATNLTAAQQMPRSMLGELSHKPLIGPWIFLLMLLLLICISLFIVQPRLYNFMFTDGGRVAVIRNETPVALRWSASYFNTELNIDPPIEGLEQPLPRQGTVIAYPTGATNYTFSGGNVLSRFAPSIFAAATKAVQVTVVAMPPRVDFEVSPGQVVGDGTDEVVVSWVVQHADNIKLYRQVGENGPVEEIGDFSDQPIQSLRVTPDPNSDVTSYILVANNKYVPTPTQYPKRVAVLTPTPTPPPTPQIILFGANPATINEGEQSVLSWVVNGVQEVRIQGIDNANTLPNQYDVAVQPTGSTEYFLTVPGVPPRPARVNVIPATPTPTTTPEPDAPEIIVFAADSNELIQGKADSAEDEKDVVLSWQVRGTVTDIELNGGPDIGVFNGLNPDDTFPVTIDKNTVFVLTASNQDKTSSKTIQVEVVEATPTPVPPTPLPTPLPTAGITSFEINSPGAPQVIQVGASIYEVYVDTEVRFRWVVDSAAKKVRLETPDGAAQTLTAVPVGSFDKIIASNGDGEYRLVAINASDVESPAQVITIQVVDKPPPNRPTNVSGTEDVANNTNTITWSWQANSTLSDLKGFKIYRADVPGGTFTALPNLIDPTARTWADVLIAPTTTCGKNYYVVAVYDSLTQTDLETDASTNSWFSSPCP